MALWLQQGHPDGLVLRMKSGKQAQVEEANKKTMGGADYTVVICVPDLLFYRCVINYLKTSNLKTSIWLQFIRFWIRNSCRAQLGDLLALYSKPKSFWNMQLALDVMKN